MSLPLYRLVAAVGRTEVISNTLGTFILLIMISLGGFVMAKGKLITFFFLTIKLFLLDYEQKNCNFIEILFSLRNNGSVQSFFHFVPADDIEPFLRWGYYISPMMYGQTSLLVNEFLGGRWDAVRSILL